MARGNGKARSGGVRALERGLALLVAMNRRKLPSVFDLARDTRLPRPTVYRLLETLSRADSSPQQPARPLLPHQPSARLERRLR